MKTIIMFKHFPKYLLKKKGKVQYLILEFSLPKILLN